MLTRSLPATMRPPAWGPTFALSLLFLLAFWAVAGLHDGPVETMVMGHDAGMRLVTLRDLLDGHGWFDAEQPRLGPEGTQMHWSRLIDAPMLAVILVAEPLLGREGAEHLLLLLWPLAVFAAVIATAAAVARRLGGGLAASLMIGAGLMAMVSRWRFMPGDIDHHNVQALLLLLALWGAVARHEHRLAATGAGLAVAASLCVGVETLPLLVLIGLGFAGIWAVRGASERTAALGFATGLGGGLAVLFPAIAPATAWRGGFCDAVSVDLAGPVVAGAALLAALALGLSDRPARTRWATLAGGGMALAGAVALLRPTCLSNPYDALDPYLVTHWLNLTGEAQGLFEKLAKGKVTDAVVAGAALIAASAAPVAAGRRALALSALILAALGIGIYQIRGMNTLLLLTLLALSVTAGVLRRRAQEEAGPGMQATSATALMGLMLLAVVVGLGNGLIEEEERPSAETAGLPRCSEPGAFSALAALPEGRVVATSNLGVPILLATGHDVLAAPYHRNQDGLRTALEILLAPTDAEAEVKLRASGADYLVVCPANGDVGTYRDLAGDVFLVRVAAGAVPAFLRPVPGTGQAAARVFTLR